MKKFNKLASVAMAAVLAFALAGCSSSDESTDAATDTGSSEVAEEAKEETDADAEAAAEAEAEAAAEEAPDLSGDWEQSNKNSEDSYMVGTIEDDVISIYWHSIEEDGTETDSIYWVGSFEAPESAEAYSWDSENDHEQTDDALLASTSDTKTFDYDDGVISFELTALGTTTTIQMEQL